MNSLYYIKIGFQNTFRKYKNLAIILFIMFITSFLIIAQNTMDSFLVSWKQSIKRQSMYKILIAIATAITHNLVSISYFFLNYFKSKVYSLISILLICLIFINSFHFAYAKKIDKIDWFAVPILSYAPTTKFVYGGMIFMMPNKDFPHQIALTAVKAQNGQYTFNNFYRNKSLLKNIDLMYHIGASNSARNFYLDNEKDNNHTIENTSRRFTFGIIPYYNSHISFPIYITLKDFENTDNNFKNYFPNEQSSSLNIGIELDYRDDTLSPEKGHFTRLITSITDTKDKALIKVEADFRNFITMHNIVWATRINAGISSYDTKSALNKYSLGGSDSLRGIKNNRLLADHFYLLQNELRFPMISHGSFIVVPIDGVLFIEYGGSKNKDSKDKSIFTKGVGIRIGVPPTYNMKIRLDVGFAEGESEVYFNINQVF